MNAKERGEAVVAIQRNPCGAGYVLSIGDMFSSGDWFVTVSSAEQARVECAAPIVAAIAYAVNDTLTEVAALCDAKAVEYATQKTTRAERRDWDSTPPEALAEFARELAAEIRKLCKDGGKREREEAVTWKTT